MITDLTPDLGNPRSIANDINDLGMVTGWMGTNENNDAHAFLWDAGNVTDLGVIPGGLTGIGMAINNHGDVAVQGRMLNDNKEEIVRSYLWGDGKWIDIGVLPGFDETRAVDLNDAGEVTGRCEMLDSTAARPFLWRDGTMWDISELWSSDDSDLSPILPKPGDLDGDGDVDIVDLLILLGSWGLCDDCNNCTADLDENCSVSTTDLLLLFANWG